MVKLGQPRLGCTDEMDNFHVLAKPEKGKIY
jgi:hypothetical protein